MNLNVTICNVYEMNSRKKYFYQQRFLSIDLMFNRGYVFVAERVSNVIDRRVANMVDDVILSEFPFSSYKRLLITESILKELE
jgi:hypothetical protein